MERDVDRSTQVGGGEVGHVWIGGGHPVVVQSMTNTDTADVAAPPTQVAALADAGSELVRVTVNNDEAAAGRARDRRALATLGVRVPIVGDFHYNGHLLLTKYPGVRRGAGQVPDQSGQRRRGKRHDENFRAIIETAIEHGKPVRIGVNWGSLDQRLLTEMMDENAQAPRAARRRVGDAGRDGARAPCAPPRWPSGAGWRTTRSSSAPSSAACRT